MDLNEIELRLKSGASLSESDAGTLRDLVQRGRPGEADKAIQLMHAYPAEARVNPRDKNLLERVVDGADPPHRAAFALSLLCNWMNGAGEEADRILLSLASRTEGGDYLCITACSCAAMVLRKSVDSRLVSALVTVFRDQTRLSSTRDAARDAHLMVDGMSQRDIIAAECSDAASLQAHAEHVASRLLSVH